MHVERRAAVERLGDAQATARANAHRRNIEATKAALATTEQRLAEADMSGGWRQWRWNAIAEKTSTLPSYTPWQERQEEMRRRHEQVAEEHHRCRRKISAHARPTMALAHQTLCHHHGAHRMPKPPSTTMTLCFRYMLVLVNFCRIT
jgi:hypothetical protein